MADCTWIISLLCSSVSKSLIFRKLDFSPYSLSKHISQKAFQPAYMLFLVFFITIIDAKLTFQTVASLQLGWGNMYLQVQQDPWKKENKLITTRDERTECSCPSAPQKKSFPPRSRLKVLLTSCNYPWGGRMQRSRGFTLWPEPCVLFRLRGTSSIAAVLWRLHKSHRFQNQKGGGGGNKYVHANHTDTKITKQFWYK